MNHGKMRKDEGVAPLRNKMFLMLGVIPIVIFFVCVIYFIIPLFSTGMKLEDAVAVAKRQDLANGYCFDDRIDWWGNKLCISRVSNKERTEIVYRAISAGRDGEFGTDDDLSKLKTDSNNSKIIGKYVGEKAVQFSKGLKEGVVIGSKHDK